MKCLGKLIALGAFLFTVTLPVAAQADVILHAFEWSYQSVEKR